MPVRNNLIIAALGKINMARMQLFANMLVPNYSHYDPQDLHSGPVHGAEETTVYSFTPDYRFRLSRNYCLNPGIALMTSSVEYYLDSDWQNAETKTCLKIMPKISVEITQLHRLTVEYGFGYYIYRSKHFEDFMDLAEKYSTSVNGPPPRYAFAIMANYYLWP